LNQVSIHPAFQQRLTFYFYLASVTFGLPAYRRRTTIFFDSTYPKWLRVMLSIVKAIALMGDRPSGIDVLGVAVTHSTETVLSITRYQ
jgi:hypothetical protein